MTHKQNPTNISEKEYNYLVDRLSKCDKNLRDISKQVESLQVKYPKKHRILDVFLDDNSINEKAIIGFISFFMMVLFGCFDLFTSYIGKDFNVSDTIYSSFVIVTLGCFGISEFGKVFTNEKKD